MEILVFALLKPCRSRPPLCAIWAVFQTSRDRSKAFSGLARLRGLRQTIPHNLSKVRGCVHAALSWLENAIISRELRPETDVPPFKQPLPEVASARVRRSPASVIYS